MRLNRPFGSVLSKLIASIALGPKPDAYFGVSAFGRTLDRLMRNEFDVVLANEAVPTSPHRPLHFRLWVSPVIPVMVAADC
jgi:hypothetical protein